MIDRHRFAHLVLHLVDDLVGPLKHREDGTFGRVRLAAQPVIDTKSEERAESVIEYGRTAPAGHLPPTQAEDALDRAIRLLALHPDD